MVDFLLYGEVEGVGKISAVCFFVDPVVSLTATLPSLPASCLSQFLLSPKAGALPAVFSVIDIVQLLSM